MDDSDLGATVLGYAAGQKVFGRFTLKKMLGRGGMGVVWLAVDDKLEREVALKFLPEVMKSDRPAMEELKKETRRALDLTHSNIVRFYDFVENESTAAISMEFISGDTLSGRRLGQPGQFYEPPALRRWVRQLCEALAYAHERGTVVHRDLKPANLMVDAHGDIKVTDFGIARSISDSVSRISAQAGTSGTPAYMSPQQMMGERPHPTDDIYSLGATLYELLTSKPPFYSGNIPAQVQSKVPLSIAARRKELGVAGAPIPPEWEATIAACLSKDVAKRPQSVREFAQRIGLPLATQTTAPFGDTASAGPVKATGAKKTLIGVLAGLVAFMLGGAGYYYGVVRPEREAAEQRRVAEDARARAEARRAREAQEQAAAEKIAEAHKQQEEAAKAAGARKNRETREASEAALAVETFRNRLRRGEIPLADIKAVATEQSPRGRFARERLEELRRDQEAAEGKARDQIMATLDQLAEGSPKAQFDSAQQEVQAYLADAPARFKPEVAKSWERHRTAWAGYEEAHRAGTLVIDTLPENVSVTLQPRDETKFTPATFTELKPGQVTLHFEKIGFEPQDMTLTVKAGIETKADVVRLVPILGSVLVSSTPAGVSFVLQGNSRRLEGVTPARVTALPIGPYRVVFHREGWPPVEKIVRVLRNSEATIEGDVRGVKFEIRSTPAGGRVILNGREVGTTPLTLTDMKFGDYRLDILRDGYENYADKISANKDVLLEVALTETPVTAVLRSLAAHRWASTSGTRTELTFDLQGNVRGSQQGVFSGNREVSGRVESYDAHTRKLTVVFTQGDVFSGRLPLEILDERTFKISVLNQLGFTNETTFVEQGGPK
ncbi:MAG: Serine/threonine-protein kinase PknB [Lacunisphaera sp.]|nr:Serine/threonine-protein kinase PknB [Lacunisphaera sp.]